MENRYKVLPHESMDCRLVADRCTDSFLPVTRFTSREEVERRREALRFNLRMAAGLWPWPERTPLNVRREPVGEYEGYSVEKIMFESRPGFWSTGNLYLPRPLPGPAPAILNFIGHWEEQRLTRKEEADYPQQLANFARMGFVCLVTDMIGKVDSRQITHRYGGGEKELWLSNGLGVQLWNNIRALDLLSGMPEVDPERIGVTGASGGGTQTLLLSLLDDRIAAAAPINMISLEMQGGCECENAPGLRRHTDNGEMCAMLAPRPLFLAGSTGDWTRNLMTREYPAMLEAYRQYGAEERVEYYYQVAGHQYNARTRRRVYRFFSRHLMGKEIDWQEQPIDVPDVQDLTWFRGAGAAPGIRGDEEFFAAHKAERTAAVAGLSRDEKCRMLAWMTGIGETLVPMQSDTLSEPREGGTLERFVITSGRGQQLPCLRWIPKDWDGRRLCLALGGEGKDCIDRPEVLNMAAQGIAVVTGDLFLTGESAGMPVEIRGGERSAKYFTTFHYSADANRVQDVALLWRAVCSMAPECGLWAVGSAAQFAACALPLLGRVCEARLEAASLPIAGEADCMARCNIPGILLLGGPEGCLALARCPVTRF